MAGRTKKAIAVPAEQEENASEVELGTPEISPLEEKPDLSRLDNEAKILSLRNLLRQMPPQYLTEDKIKESIWAIARFVPTDEQIATAREDNFNPPQRFPN